jgi:hypothetical protein
LSGLPSQSSSAPLQVSPGGVQLPGPGTWQSKVHIPVPVELQVVVQGTPGSFWTHPSPLSGSPSQSSSPPLQISAGGKQPLHWQPLQYCAPVVPQEAVHSRE